MRTSAISLSFAKKPRPFEAPRSRLGTARVPASSLIRTVLLAALVVIAAAWGLARHYSYSPPPMLVPVPPTGTPTYDIDTGEMPVPEMIEPDGS